MASPLTGQRAAQLAAWHTALDSKSCATKSWMKTLSGSLFTEQHQSLGRSFPSDITEYPGSSCILPPQLSDWTFLQRPWFWFKRWPRSEGLCTQCAHCHGAQLPGFSVSRAGDCVYTQACRERGVDPTYAFIAAFITRFTYTFWVP